MGKNCILCGGNNFKYLFSSFDWIFYPEDSFNLIKCKDCGLIFLEPKLSKEELRKYYPKEYYSSYGKKTNELSFLSKDRINLIKRFKKSGRVLDVGCQSGLFLKKLEKEGFKVYGVDISEDSCNYAKNILNLKNIYCKDIMDIEFKEDFFDIITLWHVLEHLEDPVLVLKKLYKYLKKDGYIFIECPNISSFSNIIFKDKSPSLDVPRHLWFFSSSTLKKLLYKIGFKLEKIDYFCQPVMNLSILRSSILRKMKIEKPNKGFFGFEFTQKKRNIFWIIIRDIFTFFCFILSSVFAFLKLSEVICIVAKKD